MKNANAEKKSRIARLKAMTDEDINLEDIPERLNWDGAVQGMFYRPIKQSATIRFDADILAWFKANSPKYQTAINAALREYIAQKSKR